MEGWLYLVRSNRFTQHYSRKRYFILKENVLRNFKTKPTSQMEVNFHVYHFSPFFLYIYFHVLILDERQKNNRNGIIFRFYHI